MGTFIFTKRTIQLSFIVLLIAAMLSFHAAFSGRVYARGGPLDESQAATGGPGTSSAASRSIHLVIEDNLLAVMKGRIPSDFRVTPKSKLDAAAILDAVAAGDSLVWIGEGSGIPQDLFIGTFRPATSALAVTAGEQSPMKWGSLAFGRSQLSSAYIKPTKLVLYYNVDEAPRAEFLPLLDARDRFGRVVGYPGVLMQYYAPSSARHRFAGSECFFFLFDRPAEALDAAGWGQLLELVAARFRAHLQVKQVTTGYASYHLGERVRVQAQVANWRPQAAATEIHFYAQAPGEKEFHEIVKQRSCPDALSDSEVVADFLPHGPAGLWRLRVEAWQDPAHAEELAIEGHPVLVDQREIGVVVLDGGVKTPSIISFNGPSIRLEGQDAFWAGTNYIPSSGWWDWQWRDFRPLKVAEDFAAIRGEGYRLVRMWLDPVLDEQSLRAMDAALYLAAQKGIVLDYSVFSQWTRKVGFERRDGEQVSFDFRGMRDFNVFGLSLRDMGLQRELIQVLAKRWQGVGNLIYDLSNEPYIKDPDATQMEKEVTEWDGIPKDHGVLRDTLLFRRWAKEMTTVIRQAGGTQPVLPGILSGGDNYLGNRDSEIESWHDYEEPETAGLNLSYEDPGCSGRPVILEEFGAWGTWNDEQRYDADVHYALAAGAAAAMSFEWGVSWLFRDLPFYAGPSRESLDFPPDPRWGGLIGNWLGPWPRRSGGMIALSTGYNWGSTYHGTPFPASAAIALGRLSRMGQGLGRAVRSEKVYVVVPTPYNGASNAVPAVTQAVKKLREGKVVFGVLQEDSLGSLPKSAQVVICPNGVSAESKARIEEIRGSGVQVFMGPKEDWQKAVEISRLQVTPGEGITLLARRTLEGTLYSLIGKAPAKPVSLKTEQNSNLTLGVNQYALVHERASGVNLVEASGEVTINGARFCTIEKGRAIIVSDDGQDLVRSKRLRVLATEPTRIKFTRPLGSVAVLTEGQSEPLTTFVPGAASKAALDIDSELIRYVLGIQFQPQ